MSQGNRTGRAVSPARTIAHFLLTSFGFRDPAST